jgi:hypothetical protein
LHIHPRLGMKMGWENPVPTGIVDRLNRPRNVSSGKPRNQEKTGKTSGNRCEIGWAIFPTGFSVLVSGREYSCGNSRIRGPLYYNLTHRYFPQPSPTNLTPTRAMHASMMTPAAPPPTLTQIPTLAAAPTPFLSVFILSLSLLRSSRAGRRLAPSDRPESPCPSPRPLHRQLTSRVGCWSWPVATRRSPGRH